MPAVWGLRRSHRRWLLVGVNLSDGQLLFAAWLGITSVVAFLLFGYDKWQAGRRGGRVAESTLWLVSALGGWPGGLLGIVFFRHKSAKGSFQLKFAAAFLVWGALMWGGWQLSEKLAGRRVSFTDVRTWCCSDLAAGIGQTAAGSPRLQKDYGPMEYELCG